jgi:hypothetical protein
MSMTIAGSSQNVKPSLAANEVAGAGTRPLQVHVQGVGVYGPGLSGWQQSIGVLAGRVPLTLAPISLPPPEALPAAERRRAGLTIKLAFAAGFDAVRQAGADPANLRSVFTSTGGDCENCHSILETLASSDRAVSPTRFHNSVHNAPSGYWSIATGCRATSTSLCAYDGSFAAGLLEAAIQVASAQEPCLLLAYDSPYPPPLGSVRNISHPFGVGLVLSPTPGAASATLSLNLGRGDASRLAEPALEALRHAVPAARSLPLLQHLAKGTSGSATLDYLDGMSLDVDIRTLA